MSRVLTAILTLIVVACSDSNPMEPEDPIGSVAGIWTGDVEEGYGGAGTLRLELRDDQWGFNGTFAFTFDDPSRSRSGTVKGEYASDFLPAHMALTTPGEPCEPLVDGTTHHQSFNWVVENGRLRGNYTAVGCALGEDLATTGSFDLTRLE